MKIIKMLFLLLISVGAATCAILSELKSIPVGPMLGSLISGISIPYLIPSIIDLTDNENWKSSQRKLNRAGILQKNTIIRISFAYLFRIKVDGKYLLVRNGRTKKYQPVGGAYKFTQEEANYLRDNIPVENDDRIPVDRITKRDYRLLVKNEYLRKFVRRFNKTQHRENISNLSREFVEEMFSTEILDKSAFGALSYKFCGRHMTNVEYGSVFNHYELLLADIIEVQLSDAQEQLFKNLMGVDCNKYRFATADEIKSLGVKFRTNDLEDDIANHTPKILSENTDKLMRRNKHKETITVQP
ncbi:SMODS-associated NUDIX domain-containing protein [Tindallia californiensis]|uniref:CD-NTase-associated protein 16 NUDIX domain-containing protein n=1 Tax=Tindallia californiensis TaxID=159292 RepID=A0A1H3K1S5_9FIRM|nr:HU-CCDC81 and SPOR domain-containing protein [Tindallia californiensis]SDY45464.1 hypothetical protein SAMN05192546_102173 [Tindallia californiensis]